MVVEEIVLQSEIEEKYAPSVTGGAANIPVQVDDELVRDIARIPDKLAFKIGEVADLLAVKAYVLRYWESEFQVLKPKKSKSNQRMYERRDIETLLLIKKLLYRDRFSIEGARSALKKLKKDNVRVRQMKTMNEGIEEAKDRILDLLEEIRSIRQLLK